MVTPRKKTAPGSAKTTRTKTKTSPRAKTAQKTPSGVSKKSAAAPAKAAAVEITESPAARPKRVVTTSSALETEALRQTPVEEPPKAVAKTSKPDDVKPEAKEASSAVSQNTAVPAKAEEPVKPAETENKAEAKPQAKPEPANDSQAKAAATDIDAKSSPSKGRISTGSTSAKAKGEVSTSPKPASRPKVIAKSKKPAVSTSKTAGASKSSVSGNKAPAAAAQTAQPVKKATIVTEEQKPAATVKSATVAKAAPKDNPTEKATAEVKVTAKPAVAAAKVDAPDVTAFGMMTLEPFAELWKAPEVDAMVAATQDAFEGSMTAANDVIAQMAEKFTEQADMFSDAGTHMMARYEELIETQQKSLDGVWQMSTDLMEKSGSFGAELVSWAQREMDASQADLEALAKVESLSELQELNERIFKRYVESGMSEGEKIQKMMFSAFSDGFAAMSKAVGVPLK
ncbi:hypothetical protein AUP42_20150 [Thalassospira lucentensis]|uniref:Phasin domain-containing protein n=1 Tax=Thalassospira lucentensis TaxID=168935 RepID=A0A154L4S8_9PROT|nr:hypothetical protein AUP42_20150 [Thalassospira lucentensis]